MTSIRFVALYTADSLVEIFERVGFSLLWRMPWEQRYGPSPTVSEAEIVVCSFPGHLIDILLALVLMAAASVVVVVVERNGINGVINRFIEEGFDTIVLHGIMDPFWIVAVRADTKRFNLNDLLDPPDSQNIDDIGVWLAQKIRRWYEPPKLEKLLREPL